MATAKHNIRVVFNAANQKLDLLNELQNLAKNAFGVAARAIIEQLKYAEAPHYPKKSTK